MKLYPAALLVLLLSDRKYRELIYTIFGTITITALSFLLSIYPHSNGFWKAINASLGSSYNFVKVNSLQMEGLTHSHTIWGIISVIKMFYSEIINLDSLLLPYSIFAMIIFAAISAYVIFIEKTLWRKITLIVLVMLLLPFTSSDYTLLYVFIPILFYLNSESQPNDLVYLLLFGFLLIPLNYYYFISFAKYYLVGKDVSISVIIYPLIMSTIIVLIISQGLRRKNY